MAHASKSPWPADCRQLRLGSVEIDLRYRRIHGADGVQELNPRCFDLLKLFLAEPRVLHTREDIFRKVWPGVVVEDANLTTSVWMLRRALGNGAKQWIRTVSKQGYVFDPPAALQLEILPADAAAPSAAVPPAATAAAPAAAASPASRSWHARLARRHGLAVLALLMLAVTAFAALRYSGLSREPGLRRVVLVTPLEADLPPPARWPTRLLYRWLDWQLRASPQLAIGTAADGDDGGETVVLLSVDHVAATSEWRIAARFRGPDAPADIVHQASREQLRDALTQTSRDVLARLQPQAGSGLALTVDMAQAPDLVEALDAEQSRRWSEAARIFTAVVERAPEQGFARLHLANCLVQLGQFSQARAEVDRAQAWIAALPAFLREPLQAQALTIRRDYAAAADAYASLQRRGGGETIRYRISEASALRQTGRSADAALRLAGDPPTAAVLAVPWLIEKAEAQLANRSPNDAATSAAAALALAQQRGWQHEIAQAALIQATALGRRNETEAPALYQLAQTQFAAAGDRLAMLRAGLLAQLQRGKDVSDGAELDQLLGEARSAGNAAVEIDVLRRVGMARFDAGDLAQSTRRFEQAAAVAVAAGDTVMRRRLDVYLAHNNLLQLRFTELAQRLELLKREPQQGMTALVVGLFGARLYFMRGEYAAALASLDATAAELDSGPARSQMAPALDCQRGAIHVVLGKPQLARADYRSCRTSQESGFIHFADLGEAELALYTGDVEAARRLLAPLDQVFALESPAERWTQTMDLVALWIRAGDLDNSARVADEVLPLASAAGFTQIEASLRISRAEISLARGNPAAALPDIERADALLPPEHWYERRRLRTVTALAAQAGGKTETAAQQLDALHADTQAKGDVLGELLVHSLMASNPATTPCSPERHQQLLLDSGLRGASDRWMIPSASAKPPLHQ